MRNGVQQHRVHGTRRKESLSVTSVAECLFAVT